MVDSSFLASEVLGCQFEDEFGLSDDSSSDEDDKGYIYGYLGGKVLRRFEPKFDFPAEDEVMDKPVEESLFEGSSQEVIQDLIFRLNST